MERQNHPDVEQQVFSLLLAVFILILTSLVHICHTCHPHIASGSTPAGSDTIQRDDALSAGKKVEAEGPCLACLFLNALNTSQISIYFVLSSIVVILHLLAPPQAEPFISGRIATPLQSRAPPRGLPHHA